MLGMFPFPGPVFISQLRFFLAQQPNWGLKRLIVEVYNSHHTSGRTPLNEWSASYRGRYLHITQQTQQTKIHVSAGFDPVIDRPWTYAVDRTATGIGLQVYNLQIFHKSSS
jgi:hypothetical protein